MFKECSPMLDDNSLMVKVWIPCRLSCAMYLLSFTPIRYKGDCIPNVTLIYALSIRLELMYLINPIK